MPIIPAPGNEPDPGDMSATTNSSDGQASPEPDNAPPEEDEAAKLGDFA